MKLYVINILDKDVNKMDKNMSFIDIPSTVLPSAGHVINYTTFYFLSLEKIHFSKQTRKAIFLGFRLLI